VDPSGTPNNPIYVEPFGQIDLSASYEIAKGLTVLFEGINVTDEINRSHGRHQNQAEFVTQTGARYAVGLRYTY
jgi:outer membrane receptor protein involved in Fe transport